MSHNDKYKLVQSSKYNERQSEFLEGGFKVT
jgi:hypothetical protein